MNENPSENAEAHAEPEQQGTIQTITLRPRSAVEAESDDHQVAQSLAGAPEVPKKEPLDSLSKSSTDLKAFPTFDVPAGNTTLGMPDPSLPAVEDSQVSPYTTLGFGDFRVCCNSCERTIPDTHYHCSKCDDDDFDLCMSCVQNGITCYGPEHWMIKRFKRNGVFVTSTTEKLPPKAKPKKEPKEEALSEQMKAIEDLRKRLRQGVAQDVEATTELHQIKPSLPSFKPLYNVRACNNCVQGLPLSFDFTPCLNINEVIELPEHDFLHCDTCEDFDLCQDCFAKDNHGHHPKHGFAPATPHFPVADHVSAKLAPGRNKAHNAICDGCDKVCFALFALERFVSWLSRMRLLTIFQFIRGIRHKCLDCPDWDYCNDCISKSQEEHAGHRFAPLYEPLPEPSRFRNRTIHQGICCDGPVCATNPVVTYISGVRYKCAVCPDTDFCSTCEAHPRNTHNKTHPLIKFKTAVRQATVSTFGVDSEGADMPLMGDTAPKVGPSRKPTISSPRAVVSVEPSEPTVTEKTEQVAETRPEPVVKEEPQPEKPAASAPEKKPSASELGAVYVRDTVMDGTVIQPNCVFEQTWILRNSGNVAWPAGCAVKFVGGDYMGHVDSKHPAGISELVSASESTVCYHALEPGQEYPFTVLLRTPPREGKIISYWRLTAPDGLRFGHRLWCDVNVQTPKTVADVRPSESEAKKAEPAVTSSQMVFPKLEKESPMSSVHQEKAKDEGSAAPSHEAEFDDLEDFKGDVEAWDGSDDGFLTDEEYDILDASDEEFVEDPKLKTATK